MRESGRKLAGVMKKLEQSIKAGVTTLEIDNLAEKLIADSKAQPAFKGYKGYPATTCISVNEEIVHGIPSERMIKEGDIVSIDAGINFQGYFSDMALTKAVGKVDSAKRKLIEVTKKALKEGIKAARCGNRLSDISSRIQNCVEQNGFSVVRQYVGHGIGLKLHEEPEIPNFGRAHQGPVLKAGMVLAIEPMVNMGGWDSRLLPNGWTAVTRDGLPSAHFEHTVAVTEKGPQILTNG
jgi:methionyl aminopeptidase